MTIPRTDLYVLLREILPTHIRPELHNRYEFDTEDAKKHFQWACGELGWTFTPDLSMAHLATLARIASGEDWEGER